jgi:hypothetical protein
MARWLCWIVVVSVGCGSAWSQTPPPSIVRPAHDSSSSSTEDCRVWFEPRVESGAVRASIVVDCSSVLPADKPVETKGLIRVERPVGKVTLRYDILNSEGAAVYRGKTETVLDREEGPFHFEWDPGPLPKGSYTSHFELLRPPGISIVRRDYLIRKVSLNDVQARCGVAEQRIGEMVKQVRALEDSGEKPPYLRMRVTIASDYVRLARKAFEGQDWQRADTVIRYIEDTLSSAPAELALGKSVPELWAPVTQPSPDLVVARNGSFFAGDRPVFLIGTYLGDAPSAEDVTRLASYGLNFATFSIGPSYTLKSETEAADLQAALDPVFRSALENQVGVMVSLNPQSMPSWAVEQSPSIASEGLGTVDITQPAACQVIERHFKTAVPYLARQKALEGIALIQDPAFKFTGEEIRLRFLDMVKARYKDRHEVNRAWRGLFANLDSVQIGWNHVNPRYQDSPAYRYDWQTFHQQLGTEHIEWMEKLVRAGCDKPLMVAFADNVFEPEESESGIDRETLSAQLELSGSCVASRHTGPYYAFEYPKSQLIYTLMRSFSPDKPVVNFDGALADEHVSETPCSFNYIRTAVWEAAMSGLNAFALDADLTVLRPESLEGYAAAGLDLNRLAPIVTAFQQAPAEVGIFWSMPSKIYDNGSPHLQSVCFAYEGCSFSGYKIRFITEKDCVENGLAGIKALVVPDSPAVSDEAFHILKDYMQGDGVVVRTSFSILYDEHGHTRRDIISNTTHTILVRGENLPTEYLHAMDAVAAFDNLPRIPRTVNLSGYPLEGVKSRYTAHDGQEYLYVANLRKEPAMVQLYGGKRTGHDLIQGRDVGFPMQIEPLVPMLIRLDKPKEEAPAKKR